MVKKLLSYFFLLGIFLSLILSFNPNQSKFVSFAENDDILNVGIATLAKESKSALLMDANTNTIIFEKNIHDKLPIASMTKMMSLSVIFDAINNGKIKEDDMVTISKHAADTEGSSAFIDENASYKVIDLLKTVIIASANDSMVALAEAVAGTEEHFVDLMNKKTKELGLTDTHFSNVTGLPIAEHYSSAYDCAIIYKTIMDNPIYTKYSNIWTDELTHPSARKTELVNTNRLVKTYKGCDSGKTGYTSEAKYCLTCSAKKGDMRLIAVVIGEPESNTRFREVTEMFNYGFANFENKLVAKANDYKIEVATKGGKNGFVLAMPANDYYEFIKKGEKSNLQVSLIYNEIKAPVIAGSKVGEMVIFDENQIVVAQIPLIAINSDAKQTIKDCIIKITKVW